MREPTIEQLIKCHRMMINHLNSPNYCGEKIKELNELEQLCGPFDGMEIIYQELEKEKSRSQKLIGMIKECREHLLGQEYNETDVFIIELDGLLVEMGE